MNICTLWAHSFSFKIHKYIHLMSSIDKRNPIVKRHLFMIPSNSNFSISFSSFVKFVFKILFRQLIFHPTSQPQSFPLFYWIWLQLRAYCFEGEKVNNCGSVNQSLMTQSKSHLSPAMKRRQRDKNVWIFRIVLQHLSFSSNSQVNSCASEFRD